MKSQLMDLEDKRKLKNGDQKGQMNNLTRIQTLLVSDDPDENQFDDKESSCGKRWCNRT